MPTYVRAYWPDEDVWLYEELDDRRWAMRHIEVRGADGVVVVATSLAEVLVARDSGGIRAVQAYEARFGVMPDAPFPASPLEYRSEPVGTATFEGLWRIGRERLGPPNL